MKLPNANDGFVVGNAGDTALIEPSPLLLSATELAVRRAANHDRKGRPARRGLAIAGLSLTALLLTRYQAPPAETHAAWSDFATATQTAGATTWAEEDLSCKPGVPIGPDRLGPPCFAKGEPQRREGNGKPTAPKDGSAEIGSDDSTKAAAEEESYRLPPTDEPDALNDIFEPVSEPVGLSPTAGSTHDGAQSPQDSPETREPGDGSPAPDVPDAATPPPPNHSQAPQPAPLEGEETAAVEQSSTPTSDEPPIEQNPTITLPTSKPVSELPVDEPTPTVPSPDSASEMAPTPTSAPDSASPETAAEHHRAVDNESDVVVLSTGEDLQSLPVLLDAVAWEAATLECWDGHGWIAIVPIQSLLNPETASYSATTVESLLASCPGAFQIVLKSSPHDLEVTPGEIVEPPPAPSAESPREVVTQPPHTVSETGHVESDAGVEVPQP